MDFKNLKTQTDGPIATVHFDRPNKANALNYEHLREIKQVCEQYQENDQVRVIIFTGNGNHFSSGADLSDPGFEYQVPLVQRRRRMRAGEQAIQAILDLDQITIAAWHGGAMGGGACIATACDFRIGANDSFMQYPEIDIGVNLMWKSLPLIISLVGPARAKQLVIGGIRLEAESLLAWGILDDLVSRSALLDKAQELAKFYAEKPPIAAQMIKQSINSYSNALAQSIMHMDVDQNLFASTTEDRKEAISSYLNKSKPKFTGN